MKKILILGLIFIFFWGFHYSTYALDIGNTINNTNQFEFEKEHMLQHEYEEINIKFNTYAPVVLIILVIINSIIFCILSKKYKITFKYLIVLCLILACYIISYNYINNKYPGLDPVKQHIFVGIISISVILGLFIKKNKLRILLSSLPTLVMMGFTILSIFMAESGTQFGAEDVIFLLNLLLVIEIPTQVILCPIYLFNNNNNKK